MRIPTPDELKAAGEVLVTWGVWIIVYGAITMFIGLAIIGIANVISNKSVKFIK